MGIAALVLGVLSLVLCWVPVFGNIAALVLGIVGLILAIIALRQAEKKGVAIAGLVLCAIALIVAVAMMVIIGVGVGAVLNDPAALEQLEQQVQSAVDALEATVAP